MEVGDIFEYDWVVRNASPARTSRAMPVRLGLLASRQNELPMILSLIPVQPLTMRQDKGCFGKIHFARQRLHLRRPADYQSTVCG